VLFHFELIELKVANTLNHLDFLWNNLILIVSTDVEYYANYIHKCHDSLIGRGDPVLAVVVPGGVLIQHFRPIWRPRHHVQPVVGLQRVLTPRPRLMLRLQERGGRLDVEQ